MDRALESRLKMSQVRVLAVALSCNNLRQVVCTHVPLSPSSELWCRSKGADALGWEGNRRSHWSCVTGCSGSSTYGLKAVSREMSTPPALLDHGTLYRTLSEGGSVAEWLACWTQAQ